MALCPSTLPPIGDGKADTLTQEIITISGIYFDCASRHASLVNTLNKEQANDHPH